MRPGRNAIEATMLEFAADYAPQGVTVFWTEEPDARPVFQFPRGLGLVLASRLAARMVEAVWLERLFRLPSPTK